MACVKCGCSDQIPDVRILDQAHARPGHLTVEVNVVAKPHFFSPDPVQDALRALICRNCGYAELYAGEPEQLWQAYLKRKASA